MLCVIFIILNRTVKEADFNNNIYVLYIHFILISLWDEPEPAEYLSEAPFHVLIIVKNNRFNVLFFFFF